MVAEVVSESKISLPNRILGVLSGGEGNTIQEVAAALGEGYPLVNAALYRLWQRGRVRHVEPGRYAKLGYGEVRTLPRPARTGRVGLWKGDPAATIPERVLTIVTEQPTPARLIYHKVGLAHGSVSPVLTDLVREGQIIRVRKGYYAKPATPRVPRPMPTPGPATPLAEPVGSGGERIVRAYQQVNGVEAFWQDALAMLLPSDAAYAVVQEALAQTSAAADRLARILANTVVSSNND